MVPVKRRLVAAMLLSAALPLVFFTMSFDELAKRLASILV